MHLSKPLLSVSCSSHWYHYLSKITDIFLDRSLPSPPQPTINKFVYLPSDFSNLSTSLYPNPNTLVQGAPISLLKNSDNFPAGQPRPLPLHLLFSLIQGDFIKHRLCHCPDESPPQPLTSLRMLINIQVQCAWPLPHLGPHNIP